MEDELFDYGTFKLRKDALIHNIKNNIDSYIAYKRLDGEDAEKIVPKLSESEQYLFGYKSGEVLKQIHMNAPLQVTKEDWYNRFFDVITPRIEAYKQEGIPFDGAMEVLEFIENNKELLRNRPQCGLHGDYHMGNIILTANKEVAVIDWHTIDFEDGGDPWYDFKTIGVDFPAYTSELIGNAFVLKPSYSR